MQDAREWKAALDPQSDLKTSRISKLSDVNSVEPEWLSSAARIHNIETRLNLNDPTWVWKKGLWGKGISGNAFEICSKRADSVMRNDPQRVS